MASREPTASARMISGRDPLGGTAQLGASDRDDSLLKPSGTPLMALLVGAPPPPPASPPPKKRSSSRRQRTQHPSSPAATMSSAQTLSIKNSFSRASEVSSPTARRQEIASTIEDRLRKSREMYQQPVVQRSQSQQENPKLVSKVSKFLAETPTREKPLSPTSLNTSQRSTRSVKKVELQSTEAAAPSRSKTPQSKRRKQTPQRSERTPTREKPKAARSKTPQGKSRVAGGAVEKSPKKGFFRKLFKKKPKSDASTVAASEMKTVKTEDRSREDRIDRKVRAELQASMLRKTTEVQSSTVPVNGWHPQQKTALPTVKSGDGRAHDFYFSQDDVSALTIPTVSAHSRNQRHVQPARSLELLSDPIGQFYHPEGVTIKEEPSPSVDPFTAAFFDGQDAPSSIDHISAAFDNGNTFAPPGEDPFKSVMRTRDLAPMPDAKDPLPTTSDRFFRPSLDAFESTFAKSQMEPSPRGFQTLELAQDPVGASAIDEHAPDPPLALDNEMSFLSVSSLGNHLKSEDSREASSASADERAESHESSSDRLPPSPPHSPPTEKIRVESLVDLENTAASDEEPEISVRPEPSDTGSAVKKTPALSFAHRFKKRISTPRGRAKNDRAGDTNTSLLHSTVNPASDESSMSTTMDTDSSCGKDPVDTDTSSDQATVKSDEKSPGQRSPVTSTLLKRTSRMLSARTAARMNTKAVSYVRTVNKQSPSHNEGLHVKTSDLDAKTTPNGKAGTKASVSSTPRSEPSPGASSTQRMHKFVSKRDKFRERKTEKGKKQAHSLRSRSSNGGNQRKSVECVASPRRLSSTKVDAFSVGVSFLRKKRDDEIASGKKQRCIPVEKEVKVATVQSYFSPMKDLEPKDPIQRAGRRLLAKAAVPIQACARRFLAQRQAVDRMWAILEIQSCFRRWKSEASLLAYRKAAVCLQRHARGKQTRGELSQLNVAAIDVQRVVRGYLASIHTFDAVYKIILVQARARGNSTRREAATIREKIFLDVMATKIQARVRGNAIRTVAREEKEVRETVAATFLQASWRRLFAQRNAHTMKLQLRASTSIQTWWRCYSARQQFQMLVVCVIIAQSAIRRWKTRSSYLELRDAVQIRAATKIQCAWRGFQGYTDYIFSLVDVIVVQRTARVWLAKRRAVELRRERSAVLIQKHFRRFSSQMTLLFSLVHIIMVQSVARRFLARRELRCRQKASVAESQASVKIQAAWRGFWKFSQFVIMQFQASKLQALTRGMQCRRICNLRLGSCIMIQAAARRHLAKHSVNAMIVSNIGVKAMAARLRETHACARIQFWWRVVLDCRKEKEAALVIERFFMMVKREVDREIARVERKRLAKRNRRREKKEPEDKMLERAWLTTVDENSEHTDMSYTSPSMRSSHSRKKSSRKSKSLSHRSSSPTMGHIMRHETEDENSMTYSVDSSSSKSYRISTAATPRGESMSKSALADDLSLEEAYLDASTQHSRLRKSSADKYLKMYGVKGRKAPHHFFADDLESTMSSSSIKGLSFAESSPSSRSAFKSRTSLSSSDRTFRDIMLRAQAAKEETKEEQYGLI